MSKPTYEELAQQLVEAERKAVFWRQECRQAETSLGTAERAIAEMRGERGCVCETLMATETEAIDLRQQLQAAVELNQIREEQLQEELRYVAEIQAQCAALRQVLEAWVALAEHVETCPQCLSRKLPICDEWMKLSWHAHTERDKVLATSAGKARQPALKHSSSSGLSPLDIVDDRLGPRCLRCGEDAEVPAVLCQECKGRGYEGGEGD